MDEADEALLVVEQAADDVEVRGRTLVVQGADEGVLDHLVAGDVDLPQFLQGEFGEGHGTLLD